MELLVYSLLFLIFYTYFGYAMLIIALSQLTNKNVSKGDSVPTVTLMVAAYNEEKHIEKKIKNSLALDYPKDKLKIVIVSDASSDQTDIIVENYRDKGVELIRVEGRVGKTDARNIAMKKNKSEITIFSDATTQYEADVIKKLVRNFSDHNVGMVTGHLKYKDSADTQMGYGQSIYWRYESLIKKAQTKLGTLTGSVGCITAFRTKAYTELPNHIIEDFTEPLIFVQKGYRVVFEEGAVCYEETTQKSKTEWHMRVRVIRGGMTGLLFAKKVLNPFKYPIASFQLISHKLFRWLMPIFGLFLFFATLIVFNQNIKNTFIDILMYSQCLFYLTSLLAFWFEKYGIHNKIMSIPLYFVVLNSASLVALYKVITSKLEATWETNR